jgi:hypothetical protein
VENWNDFEMLSWNKQSIDDGTACLTSARTATAADVATLFLIAALRSHMIEWNTSQTNFVQTIAALRKSIVSTP